MMQEIKRLSSRIFMMIGKALISSVSDTTGIQLAKIRGLSDEVQDKVERIQNFGFTSVPPADSETIIGCIGGNRDHMVILACDSATYRKKDLKSGESAIYDKNGNYIYLKEDGTVEIKASSGVFVDGDFEIDGDLTVSGDIDVTGNVSTPSIDLNGFYEDYLIHVHPGVTIGTGSTGPPT